MESKTFAIRMSSKVKWHVRAKSAIRITIHRELIRLTDYLATCLHPLHPKSTALRKEENTVYLVDLLGRNGHTESGLAGK